MTADGVILFPRAKPATETGIFGTRDGITIECELNLQAAATLKSVDPQRPALRSALEPPLGPPRNSEVPGEGKSR
jgi:hypothetical protein